jgi:hypothetical protein
MVEDQLGQRKLYPENLSGTSPTAKKKLQSRKNTISGNEETKSKASTAKSEDKSLVFIFC